MSIIYETSGRAREYFELAANLYTGCDHACIYCYGSNVTRKDRKEFHTKPKPRANLLRQLERDAARLETEYETRHVLLCFVTDPYQIADVQEGLTRRAIEVLHKHNLGVAILTKGGSRAKRDFDLLNPGDLFGSTLTFTSRQESFAWEPNAATPLDRLETLKAAHDLGIPTWASLEPVIDPKQSLELIRAAADFIDVFKVGTLNYRPEAKKIDWRKFALDAVKLLDSLGANYYIKKDLARHIGQPDGIRKGDLPK